MKGFGVFWIEVKLGGIELSVLDLQSECNIILFSSFDIIVRILVTSFYNSADKDCILWHCSGKLKAVTVHFAAHVEVTPIVVR